MFKAKELAYAMDPKGDAYSAAVLKVRRGGDARRAADGQREKNNGSQHEYFVHYQGWKPKWDEWYLF